MSTNVICLVGARGSGKSTAAQILREHGFWIVSAGKKNRELAVQAGCSLDTNSLQNFGQRMLVERGERYFASVLAEAATDHPRIVFDGVRSPGVIRYLSEFFPTMKVILVTAGPDLRHKRLIGRGDDPALDVHPIESYVEQYVDLADVELSNSSGLESFTHALLATVLDDSVRQ